MKRNIGFVLLLMLLAMMKASVAQINKLIVSQDGTGDFKSVQAALASLPDSAAQPRLIFIKRGTYREKVYIEKHNVVLEGENREGVVLTYPVAREEWRCQHADDWGVATLNIDGNDITLKNLTVTNSFGFDWKSDKTVKCPTDTSFMSKTITREGHQMAVRTMAATRFKAIHCSFISYAGDTMSPWNVKEGLFYFKDCYMEGGVDLYCPRGWAFAENCTFKATRGKAIIWHDGSQVEDSKTVLKNCVFEGYDGFQLGRYHRDAQFFLVNCTFAQNMADAPIERIATKNVIKWGHRVYFYNCHKNGGDYTWFADNYKTSPNSIEPEKISPEWVFGNKWNPVKN